MNTIVAISTPIGTGAINIIRMSGPAALLIIEKIFKPFNNKKLEHSKLILGNLNIDNISDKCFCVYFKNPNSYTGEDLIEIQTHGSYKLSELIVKKCVELGAIPANKGEFTKKAFLNGKITLSEAEGIIDMINSESESQLNAASKIMNGTFSKKIKQIQNSLIDSVAEFETSFDYPDEYDGILEERLKFIKNNLKNLKEILNNSKYSQQIKNGINIVFLGNPNSGKSSLLNALLKENKAIVTSIPGTTRDVIEGSLEYKGLKFNFFDTAGIRKSDNKIEKIGIKKSKEAIKFADIIIFIKDIDDNLEDFSLIEKINKNKKIIKIINKIDKNKKLKNNNYDLFISAKYNINIIELLDLVYNKVINENIDTSGIILTSQRHIDCLKSSINNLESFLNNYSNYNLDCSILDLKNAYFDLGQITGDTANEDIITHIFEKFCVGK